MLIFQRINNDGNIQIGGPTTMQGMGGAEPLLWVQGIWFFKAFCHNSTRSEAQGLGGFVTWRCM